MKIGIVINTSWNIFNFRSGLIKALIKDGHQIVCIAPEDSYSERLRGLGCSFIPCSMDNKGTSPIKDGLLLSRLIGIYRKVKPDVILHYTIKPNVYGTLAAALCSIPCISNVSGLGTIFLHETWSSVIAKWLYKLAFRYPKHIFFQNETDQALFLRSGLVKLGRSSVLPGSGVDLQAFSYQPLPERIPFRFLMLSRLLYDKGVVHYVEAVAALKAKGYEFEAILQGFTDFESSLGIPENLLREWQKRKLITWLEPTDHPFESISNVHCVVLPSYREGTPRSLLEAAACGRPVITTSVPGCMEVVAHGVNGLLCKERSSKALEEAMEEMLNTPADILTKMGKAGREMVVNSFDEQMVIHLYRKAISGVNHNSE